MSTESRQRISNRCTGEELRIYVGIVVMNLDVGYKEHDRSNKIIYITGHGATYLN